MVRNVLILMDASPDAEKLLDCSLRVFSDNHNQLYGAFVEGICSDNLNEVFSNNLLKENQYTRSEIIKKILHTNTQNTDKFINAFVKKCDKLNLKTKVYLTPNDVKYKLSDESVYNDVFLVGKNIFNKSNFNKHLFKNIEHILYSSKCPLFILDSNQNTFKNIVMIYDGSKRSFEAIKMFTYLVDHLIADNSNNLLIFTVVNSNSTEQEINVINYIKQTRLNFSIQHAYPESYYIDLTNTLKSFKNFILVTGVNRHDIIEDMAFNKDHSLFLKLPCSIFLT
jgi:hypothetical protein